MKIVVKSSNSIGPSAVRATCPHCRSVSVLESLGQHDIAVAPNLRAGQRVCPNPQCRGHIFVVHTEGQIKTSYPPTIIDFDAGNIPAPIADCFTESLKCYAAGCTVAAAMMVRRTLEEICEDKGSTGKNLMERIRDLRSKIVLPEELLEAMDELRLLGNDAAHIEAKEFEKIGPDELDAAIALTKEIMKAIYQYSTLLDRLRGLKKKC